MKEIVTNEHLLFLMQSGKMRLSRHDLKFVQNILYMINQAKPITTNQVSLYDKLCEKYQRQLSSLGLTEDKIKSLAWTTPIQHSDPYYTEAFISINDDKIYFRAPFNKKFLSSFKSLDYNPFTWDKSEKRYSAKYSTFALKSIVDITPEHYSTVNYCPIVKRLVDQLSVYDNVEIWNPTLIKSGDNYFIGGINNALSDAIKDINLNSNFATITELARFGVSIHNTIINDDPKLIFASQYCATVDQSQIADMVEWLKELGCDGIFTEKMSVLFKSSVRDKLDNLGIPVYSNLRDIEATISKCKYPVKIRFTWLHGNVRHTTKFKKVIQLTDSRAIEFK